jgi:hypothetical protein
MANAIQYMTGGSAKDDWTADWKIDTDRALSTTPAV